VLRLTKRIRGTNQSSHDKLLRRLERIVSTAQQSWLQAGSTCAAIGTAYGELGKLDEAVSYYERALLAEPASVTVEAIEQLANLLSRAAAKKKEPLLKVMKRSTELLQCLSGLGRSGERQALLGGAAKRYAQKASGNARIKALKEMTAAYQVGYEVKVNKKESDPWYPLANTIAGRLALKWQPGAPKSAATGIADDMDALRQYAKNVPASSTSFWELVLPADVLLLEAAIDGQLNTSRRKTLEAAYRDAAVRAGTPREVMSATGQIEFLRDMAASSKRAEIKRLRQSFDELLESLAEGAST
jgi:tetratricopeptide (TPR) repeat protein